MNGVGGFGWEKKTYGFEILLGLLLLDTCQKLGVLRDKEWKLFDLEISLIDC